MSDDGGWSTEDARLAALFDPDGVLAIVGSGYEQVWDRDPAAGAMRAREAYIGPAFRANMRYAEERAERILILSPTFGLMTAEHTLLGPEIARFDRPDAGPVTSDVLRAQLEALDAGAYRRVDVVGLRAFCAAIALAVEGTVLARTVVYPFGTHPYPLGGWVSTRSRVCPRCAGRDVVPIVYGLPGGEMFEEELRGQIMLGGCVLPPDGRNAHCTTCGLEWGADGRLVDGTA